MRKIMGVWDQYKDQANQLMVDNGYGDNVFACKVSEISTGDIGWACSWIMKDQEDIKILALFDAAMIPVRHGNQPTVATFDQAIGAEGFVRVQE